MKKGRPTVYESIAFVFKKLWRSDKGYIVSIALEGLCTILIPLLAIYLPKLAIDIVTNGFELSHNVVLKITLAFLAAIFLYTLSGYMQGVKNTKHYTARVGFMLEIFKKTLFCDYDWLEGKGRDEYHKVMQSVNKGDESEVTDMVTSLTQSLVGALGLVIYLFILGTFRYWIVLMLLASSVVVYFMRRWFHKVVFRIKTEMAPLNKKFFYACSVASDITSGKDIRMYHMKHWINNVIADLIDRLTKKDTEHVNNRNLVVITSNLLVLICNGFVYVYLIRMVTAGEMPVGQFILYFGAVTGFSAWLAMIVMNIGKISGLHLSITEMMDYFSYSNTPEPQSATELTVSEAPSIEFVNVSFSYDEDSKILDDFNLTIKHGEKIALVGVNGAGKTTLIKLLCGLYAPQSGKILINGIDINNIKRESLHALLSCVFQDITILPFTVAENVAMLPSEMLNRGRVTESLRLAGICEDVERLPNGMDSEMLKIKNDGGVILSGGQQQKLILARALYKDAPILILDEPTAALDAIAESRLYEMYFQYCLNKTAIFVSHRLSSTKFCDRIILLDQGQIAETGTHQELMSFDSAYRAMFEVQSNYYVSEGEEVGVIE